MDKNVSKKDYLSKYLSGGDKKRKKRRVVTSSSTIKTSRVVDDDIDLKNMRPLDENELDIYDLAEDAPQIAGIVDERPDELKVMTQYRETKKWKVVTKEYEDVKITAVGGSESDDSPAQRVSDGSDSDVSVKRNKKNIDSDPSPPRRGNKSSSKYDSDASPPRKRTSQEEVSRTDLRGRTKHKRKSDSDESPPRRKARETDKESKRHKDDERRNNKSERHRSPKRSNDSKKRGNEPSRSDSDPDLSPPRKKHREVSRGESSRSDNREDRQRHGHKEDSRMKKTLDGKKAGLQNAADMKKEADELRRAQKESLAQLGDDVSGRGAAAVMRDKATGRRRDFQEEARQKKEKEAKRAEIVEKYAVWGKGLKQIEDKTERMREEMHEMAKPVARYADDEDLEEMQKNEEKEGDPMLEYMRQKRRKENKVAPGRPQYQGSYLPNRYNIKPGHKWDGVDRSNGYEKKFFEERSNRKALEEEAYKWSTEDM